MGYTRYKICPTECGQYVIKRKGLIFWRTECYKYATNIPLPGLPSPRRRVMYTSVEHARKGIENWVKLDSHMKSPCIEVRL